MMQRRVIMLKKQIHNGIVIGRFQVNSLHEGHKALLDSVAERANRLIIFVGLSPNKCTIMNPLDFKLVQSMLQDCYPEATIQYIKDVESNTVWSKNLDTQIENLIGPNQNVVLFGSRDSFIPYYSGKYEVEELTQETYFSGTEIRKQLASNVKNSDDFRAGAIWAMQNQWSTPKMCIDSALFNDNYTQILLGRKINEDKYRLIGGFVEGNETLEETLARESFEEAHVQIKDSSYVKSFIIDDWRYRGERDKILSSLFTSTFIGKPEPGDDICELKWFDFNEDLLNKIVYEHIILIDALLSKAFIDYKNSKTLYF